MIVKFKDDDIQEFYAEVDREIQFMMQGNDEVTSKRPPPGHCSSTETPVKSEPEADVAWWRCMVPPNRKDRWSMLKTTAMILLAIGGYLTLLAYYFTHPADNALIAAMCILLAIFVLPASFISVGILIGEITKAVRDNRRLMHAQQCELRASERQEREEMLK